MASRNAAEGKRQEIMDAAVQVFGEHGFVGANLDDVVATAAVSKQTLYKHFTDKAGLFKAIVLRIGDIVDDQFLELPEPDAIDDVEEWINTLALRFSRAVMDPRVQRIRRLVIAEAPRFPDMATTYWETAFQRVLATVADHFASLADAGHLTVDHPMTASEHFAALLLYIPINRTMFSGHPDLIADEELEKFAAKGAAAFLRAYGAGGSLASR